MAYPVILVDSATGSDTQASGAGPTTALYGTTDASTDGAGTTVTLTSGTDLTNVATDGSHVIFLNDSTAGARNFGKITGKAGSGGATPTVTVANAFGLNLTTKSWAIGGKRASIGGTTSSKLFANGGANGDMLPGWTCELQSGHAETISNLNMYRAGDLTSGPITLRGAAGGTRPVLSVSTDQSALVPRAAWWVFKFFELASTGAKSSGAANCGGGGNNIVWDDIKIVTSGTNKWTTGFYSPTGNMAWRNCEIANTAGAGIGVPPSVGQLRINACYIHHNGGAGIDLTSGPPSVCGTEITDCLIVNNTGDGARWTASRGDPYSSGLLVVGNTFYNNGGDGLEILSAPGADMGVQSRIASNIFANNGGYGINWSHASSTATALEAAGPHVVNNDFYANTSGKYNPSGLTISEGERTVDPQFTNAAGGDFSIGTNLKALGFPTTTLLGSATRSYVDIGAAQRQERAPSTYRAMLLLSTYTFNPDHDYVSDVVAYEAAGGTRQTLASRVVTIDDSLNSAVFDFDDVTFPTVTTGQTLGGMIVYRYVTGDSDSVLVGWYPFTLATDGTNVTVTLPAPASGGGLQAY